MAQPQHYYLALVVDAVSIPEDAQGRIFVARVRKAAGQYVPGLRLAVRRDGTVWLEQQQQDSDGSAWWPVSQIALMRDPTVQLQRPPGSPLVTILGQDERVELAAPGDGPGPESMQCGL